MLFERTEDVGLEKHVPVMIRTCEGIMVKVGSVPHPMQEKHYIEWIEVIVDGEVYMKFLNPRDKPEVEFAVQEKNIEAREYCNLHGLWKS